MWIVICCGAALITVTMGLRAGFGLFLAPISVDLGMGREVFAFAVAVQNLVWGAASPFFGGLADKYGAVRVSIVGTILYIAGLVLMAFTAGPFQVIAGNLLVGLAIGAAGISTVIGSVSRMVSAEKRSLVLGILTAGGSIGQFALVPVTQLFIDELGWSAAFIGLAIIACTMFPMIWGVRRRRRRRRRPRPDCSPGAGGGLHPPGILAADRRLLRLRLPCGVRRHPPAGLSRRQGHARLARRIHADAGGPV
jgi:MFS family permease